MSVVNRVFAAILVLAIASASTVLVAADNVGAQIGERRASQDNDESVPPSVLTNPDVNKAAAPGDPRLIVYEYNVSKGLVAVYQSETGKRVLFKARFRPDGGIAATIRHRDPTTNKLVPLIVPSKQLDASGKGVEDLEIAGVDLRAFLKSSRLKGNGHAEKEQQLKQFLATETGQTLLDAMPALYAGLEGLEPTPEVADLLAPFGAIAMALQVGTKQFRCFKHADKIVGNARAQAMRDGCLGVDDCVLRGKHFIVHRSGLFDVLSKHKGVSVGKRTQTDPPLTPSTGLALFKPPVEIVERLQQFRRPTGIVELIQQLAQTQQGLGNQDRQKDLDGRCRPETMNLSFFGLCGPGDFTPGNVATAECYGHDYCACAYGHSACLYSVPDGCGLEQSVTCYSLLEAAASFLEDLWTTFWAWFWGGDGIDDDPRDEEIT